MRTAADIIQNNVHDIISVTPDTTIYNALLIMSKKNLGAILVKEKDEFVGIWTERDLLHEVIEDGFDVKKALVRNYMSKDLKSADLSDTVYDMMDKFLGLRVRHLLVKESDKVVGVLSIGDVSKETLREKTKEIESLNALASWEYYEEWKPRTAE